MAGVRVCRWAGVVVALLLGGLANERRRSCVGVRLWRLHPRPCWSTAVVDERALIAWDGAREDIVMSFNVTGSSDTAAWVMPVPSAAQVSLGEADAFEELGRLTAPGVEYRDSWWPTFGWLTSGGPSEGAMAGAPPGACCQRSRPSAHRAFRCSAARGAGSDCVAKWLTDNAFPHPDGLDTNLAPYIADGWEIVAVKLAPAAQGESLTGDLQPLRLSFRSDEVVYPMRLSRSASTPQTVDLYVLAAHRMDPKSVPVAGIEPSLEFAGRIEGTDVSPALADFVGNGAFLTRWNNYLPSRH